MQNTNTKNILHKRQQYVIKQIHTKLTQNNLMITKADKGKTIVIINQDTYTQKVEQFLKGNQFLQLHKDPTVQYLKPVACGGI
jgi:hypothetical protein